MATLPGEESPGWEPDINNNPHGAFLVLRGIISPVDPGMKTGAEMKVLNLKRNMITAHRYHS